MNIQHSARTDQWGTPVEIIEMAREVLGSIDLDPASSSQWNESVKAHTIFNEAQDGLKQAWFGNVFVNPPGGKNGRRSKSGLFWETLMSQRLELRHAVFLAFSAESLQNTQGKGMPSMLDFPICVPAKRIRFVAPGSAKTSPSHSNVIVYVSGSVDCTDKFEQIFSALGKVKR